MTNPPRTRTPRQLPQPQQSAQPQQSPRQPQYQQQLSQHLRNQERHTPEPTTPEPSSGASARISLGRVFKAESANYLLLLGTTLFLVIFGLVMVLSSSSVDSYLENAGFFGGLLRQGIFALVGLPMMLLVSRLPSKFWQVKWEYALPASGLSR